MDNPTLLEACYKRYITDIAKWLPDGVIDVDITLLQKLDLLNYHHEKSDDSSLTRYFHIVESEGKLTLANDDFVVWIVPEKVEEVAVTYTFIALNHEDSLNLEVAFVTTGIYNNSQLVLRLLEKFLLEIQETESLLKKFT